jgi:fructokinase
VSSIAILGEALIDLRVVTGVEPREEGRPAARSYTAQPGGSPFNVAIGLGRLGHRAAFAGRLADDALGGILRRHAQQSGVSLELAGQWPGPTPAALFDLNEDGSARYEFHLGDDAGESIFSASDGGRVDVAAVDAVHFGSIAAWLPGCAASVLDAVARLRRGGVFVSYDPNIRGMLIRDKDEARGRVEDAVSLSDLVKASVEDLAWLYPELGVADVAQQWLRAGVNTVIVTHGAEGADCYTAGGMLHGSSKPVAVVDTVGAGDAFMAALLDGIGETGAVTQPILDAACAYAAATCAVPGADPPWRSIPVHTA